VLQTVGIQTGFGGVSSAQAHVIYPLFYADQISVGMQGPYIFLAPDLFPVRYGAFRPPEPAAKNVENRLYGIIIWTAFG